MDLQKLVVQPDSKRDENWEQTFLQAFPLARVEITDTQAQTGPDGWPYLLVKTSEVASEPVVRVLGWLRDKGIGLVLNSHKGMPDYIFTYGMIWNFLENGRFITPTAKKPGGSSASVYGKPDPKFLPGYVAQILCQFLSKVGADDPRILVIGSEATGYDLCFSLESLGEPPESEHEGILQAFAWFLPSHYSLMLTSEKDLPQFISLKNLIV